MDRVQRAWRSNIRGVQIHHPERQFPPSMHPLCYIVSNPNTPKSKTRQRPTSSFNKRRVSSHPSASHKSCFVAAVLAFTQPCIASLPIQTPAKRAQTSIVPRSSPPSTNIQLKRLKPPPDSRTPGTAGPKPPPRLLRTQRINALLAEAANALRARVTLAQKTRLPAAGAVDLHSRAARVRRRGVGQAGRGHVEVLAGAAGAGGLRFRAAVEAGLDGGEGLQIAQVWRGRGERASERRRGVRVV